LDDQREEIARRVEIRDIGHAGDGVGRLDDGRVVFVPRTIPGEIVDVEILERGEGYVRGRAISFDDRSGVRIDPDCPYFEECGGCQFWHVPYEREVDWKFGSARELAERNAGFELPEPERHPAPDDRRYRSRVRFHRRRESAEGDRWPVGFFARGTDELVEVDDCLVAEESVGEARRRMEPGLEEVGPIELRVETADESSCVVTINPRGDAPDEPPESLVAFAEKLEDEPAIRGVRFLGGDREWVGGDATVDGDRVLAEAPVESVRLPPGLFRQANSAVNRRMVERVREMAEAAEAERVLELFCGVGNFTFAVGDVVRAVLGVERSEVAVEMAETMAEFTRREEIAFLAADLSDGLSQHENVRAFECDTVLLDPPRGGAGAVCRDLVDWEADRILYVSCDPAALGRDLAVLDRGAWRPRRVEMFDMFPRTSHVEVVAELAKSN